MPKSKGNAKKYNGQSVKLRPKKTGPCSWLQFILGCTMGPSLFFYFLLKIKMPEHVAKDKQNVTS